MAVIRVEDDGFGIPHEVLPHIFELFTRNESRDAPAGLGVGLAVVDELARLHGGGVDARSPGVGKGSVFTLRLPLRQPAKPESA
jgi:signal transduction histidine kinase